MKKFTEFSKVLAGLSIISVVATSSAFAQSNLPTLKVVTPSENQTIFGNKVPILFAPTNFEIVDYTVNNPKSGQGHIHVWLDDQNPTAESAKKVVTDSTSYTDVPYGNHVLKAELVTNDHKSQKPPVVVTVNFKNEPISSPTPAAASGFDKSTALVILVVVALVIVAAWWYTKEEDEPLPTVQKTKPTPKKKSKSKKSKR